jgi:3-oxoacyl-[acyl-carrier protein] reductase
MKFLDKTVIITGSGSGIGRAAALQFSKQGAKVIVVDINEQAAQETAELIRANDGQAAAFKCNIMNKNEVNAMVDFSINTFGSVDILINNAGIGVQAKNFEELSEEELDRLIGVNIKGVYFGCQAVIPHMKKNGFGVIINTASASGLRPRTGNAMYSTTKGAVITLTKALAIELAPFGIRVTGVNPVAVETNVLTQLMGEKGSESHRIRSERMINSIPLGRLATPDDIANAMVFLASEEAALVTGSFIDVDGGRGI